MTAPLPIVQDTTDAQLPFTRRVIDFMHDHLALVGKIRVLTHLATNSRHDMLSTRGRSTRRRNDVAILEAV